MKEIATKEPTPEQLLQMLDAELVAQRAGDPSPGRNRTVLLVGGVLFIVIAATVALVVLLQMLSDLERAPGATGSRHVVHETVGKF